jgi:hypothetical protein
MSFRAFNQPQTASCEAAKLTLSAAHLLASALSCAFRSVDRQLMSAGDDVASHRGDVPNDPDTSRVDIGVLSSLPSTW